jgi:hypothetical protein
MVWHGASSFRTGLSREVTDDGRGLYFVQDGRVHRVDLATGSPWPRKLEDGELTWARDQSWVAFFAGTDSMRLIDVPSGQTRFSFHAPDGFEPDHRHPWIETTSHDRTLALHFEGPKGGIFLIDVATGATRLRFDDCETYVRVTSDGMRAIAWSKRDWSRNRFKIINCSDGEVIGQYQLPDGESIKEFSPNGTLVFTERRVQGESRDWAHEVISLRSVPNFELLAEKEEEAGMFSCKFDPFGRYVSYEHENFGHVVDLSTKPPTWIDAKFSGCPEFSKDGKYFFVSQLLAGNSTQVTIYESASRAKIASYQNVGQVAYPHFSPTSRFLVLRELTPSQLPHWLTDISEQFNTFGLLARYSVSILILDLKSGGTIRKYPGDMFLGFGPAEETFWTVARSENDDVARICQWSIHAPGAPWWLWALSGLGVILVLRNHGLSRRRRNAA